MDPLRTGRWRLISVECFYTLCCDAIKSLFVVVAVNEVDNFLAVLLPPVAISQIYQKLCPQFLANLEKEPTSLQMPAVVRKQQGPIRPRLTSALSVTELYRPKLQAPPSHKRRHSSFNSFHAIQSQLNSNKSGDSRAFTTESLLFWKERQNDWVDSGVNKCCPKCACLHRLDRVYLKTAILVLLVMFGGCLFVIFYYEFQGTIQADDAMLYSIQSIGDRAKDIMSAEVE